MAPGVAARVAGWQLRLGGQAGPLGPVSAGSGDSPNGSPLQVEILLDGIWTDITSRVMTRDGSFKVAVTRGQPNEASKPVPATCAFQLNNRDGLFSPRNPVSPYYGKIGRNTQLRVSVPSGNAKSIRFWGEVSDWPQRWDTSGTDVWVELQAGGILRRGGQGAAPIGSTLRIAITAATTSNPVLAVASGITANPVVAYWPCEDLAGSTSLASGFVGGAPMAITGTPTLASFTQFVCSAALPVMADGTFTAALPAYRADAAVMVRFLLAVPSGGATDGQVLCSFTSTGTVRTWEVYYTAASGGLVGMRGRDGFGTIVADVVPGGGSSVNGQLVMVSAELTQLGADIQGVINVLIVGSTLVVGRSVNATSSTIGTVTAVSLAPGRGLTNTTLGHLFVQTAPGVPGDQFALSKPLAAWVGEAAAARISRLCSTGAISYEQVGTSTDTVAMGYQLSATLLGLVDDCATADLGILYEQTNALGLGYRTRVSLENQAAAVALSYTAFNLAGTLSPVDDDQHTRNDITVTRQGGSSARQTLTAGALSTLPPPAGVGTYPNAVTVNVQSDSTLPSQAGWRLHLGTVDEARFPTVEVNLAHSSFPANPALRQQVLALRPGDRLTISNPPAWLPPDLISQIVIGFTESIDHFEHKITFNCVPESPYHTALLEDPVLGRLDTGGSQLAADALPTDTTLLVTTTAGPLWTTAPADWPFDVRISGEQITVTGVTGAVSPQQFTCTRSVNGVVKPLAVGADVRLNQPMILAL